MTFPMNFDDYPEKEALNLRVLRRVFSPNVIDYTLSISSSTIYHFLNNKWEKLQVTGPLFVLRLKGHNSPMILILNNTCFKNPKDYNISVSKSTQIAVEGQKVFLKFKDGRNVCVSTQNETDAKNLLDKLVHFVSPDEELNLPIFLHTQKFDHSADPTYLHLMKFIKVSKK